MKFDHFGVCHGLPPSEREEFTKLKASCSQKGVKRKRTGMGCTTANSTGQYYRDSAVYELGLVDTDKGIRFGRDVVRESNQMPTSKQSLPFCKPTVPSLAEINTKPEYPTNGISILMLAATNPLIRAEYENRKASQLIRQGTQVVGRCK